MALLNFLRVLRVLQRAEEVKAELDYCRGREGCSCRAGEMCQRALAKATGLSDNAIKNMILRLEAARDELKEDFPFEIRNVKAGMNQPRKFIRLRPPTPPPATLFED